MTTSRLAKRELYILWCHTRHGSLLYTLVMRLLMHVPKYCSWVCIHLVQCFRYVCVTAIILLSLQSASAVMMLHHYCQKTTRGAIIQPGNVAKRAWIISPKPPVSQPFPPKTLFGLD